MIPQDWRVQARRETRRQMAQVRRQKGVRLFLWAGATGALLTEAGHGVVAHDWVDALLRLILAGFFTTCFVLAYSARRR